MSNPTLVTFIVYFVFLLGIGFYFYRKSVSIEDYLLGGRGMGAWVTALSARLRKRDRTSLDSDRPLHWNRFELEARIRSVKNLHAEN